MITCRSVTAAYNGQLVLRGIDLDVAAGEWVALIGPNGAGKSSLLRVIVGALPASGSVEIGALNPSSAAPRSVAELVAFVPQQPILPEGMTVFDYALLGRTPYIPWWRMESASDIDRTHDVLARVDLGHLPERPLDHLSGGELQRAILARALVQDTPVLLLDEPTAALDIGHQQQVLELIDELRREKGLAVLSAFHDLTLAAQYADRLVLMAEGVVAAAGSAETVLSPPVLKSHYGADVNVLRDDAGGIVVTLRRP